VARRKKPDLQLSGDDLMDEQDSEVKPIRRRAPKPKVQPTVYTTNGQANGHQDAQPSVLDPQSMEGWSEVRIRAYKHRDTQPNSTPLNFILIMS
jgi:hypothetical protein